MMKKLYGLFIALLLVCSALPLVSAGTFVSIDDVELNGVELSGGKAVFIERDSRANVRVEFRALADVKNVKTRAWIGGYEHGSIQDVQGPVDVKNGVTNVVNLGLNIPGDIEASKDYVLHVEVFNEESEQGITYTVKLNVEEKRHFIELYDVLFTPGLTIDAGQALFVNARVKNRGALEEKDIRVSVKIAELGIEQAVYVDKLVPEASEDKNTASSASTNDIWIDVPEDAERKNYKLLVEAEFNGRRDKTTKEYTLTVNGEISKELEDSKILINAAESVKQVIPEKEAVYTLDLANLNKDSKVLTPEIVGLKEWASVETNPSVLTIGSGEVSQMLVRVTPNSDAAGEKVFVLKLIENGRTVKEVQLKAVVGGGAAPAVAGRTALTSGLGLVFVVLLALLIILGIIIAVKKSGREETEAPIMAPAAPTSNEETKSYY